MTRATVASNARIAVACRGFSLIELMICLAIVAAISAYAWPTYREYLWRGHRATLVASLLQAANYLERLPWEAKHGMNRTGCPTLPAGLARSPPHGAIDYRISVSCGQAPPAAGYLLQARPVAGAPTASDTRCGIFELDSSGKRSNLVDATQPGQAERNGPDVDYCWNGR